MAFKDVERGEFTGATAQKDRISMSVANDKSIRFNVSSDLYEFIGAPKFVKVQVGTGEHAGMILLTGSKVKSKSSYSITRQHGRGQASFTVAGKKIGVDCDAAPKKTEKVSHHKTDDGIVVEFQEDWIGPIT